MANAMYCPATSDRDILLDSRLWLSQRFNVGSSRSISSDIISNHTAHDWRIERLTKADSRGYIRTRSVLDSRVVAFGGDGGFNCSHDSVAARQSPRQDFTLVHAAQGDARLEIDGQHVDLKAGTFVITDSARPMALDVCSRFSQFYFIFPKKQVLSAFPFVEGFVGVPFGPAEGLLAFFLDHLTSIEHHLGTFVDHHADTLLNATLQLLAMTLSSVDPDRMVTTRERQLFRIKSYIEARLAEPDLDVASIALENSLNIRYLHKMFSQSGVTVSNWVRKRRLEMCRQDFDAPAFARRSITEIALRWGFNDMSHFSKAFKQEFGMAPRAYRARHQV